MNEKKFSLTTSHLFLELKAVGAEVERQIHMLNWGGCCVYAAILANELRTLLTKDAVVEIRVIERDHGGTLRPLNEVRQELSSNDLGEWYNADVYFHHVFLEIRTGGCIIHTDSEESHYTMNSDRSKIAGHCKIIRPGFIEFDDAVDLAKQTRWNLDFDRRQIGLLQMIIRSWANHIRATYDVPWARPQAEPLFKKAEPQLLDKEESTYAVPAEGLINIAQNLGYAIAA